MNFRCWLPSAGVSPFRVRATAHARLVTWVARLRSALSASRMEAIVLRQIFLAVGYQAPKMWAFSPLENSRQEMVQAMLLRAERERDWMARVSSLETGMLDRRMSCGTAL